MKYQIKTLTSEDFDLLPYSRARESVGVTDRLLGISYIRDTGDVDFDVDTVLHEINEMESKVSPYGWSHEDKYGVRYKNFFRSGIGEVIKNIAMPITMKPVKNAVDSAAQVAQFIPGPWQLPARLYNVGNAIYEVSNKQISPQEGVMKGVTAAAAGPASRGWEAGWKGAAGSGVLNQVGAGVSGVLNADYLGSLPGMGKGGALSNFFSGSRVGTGTGTGNLTAGGQPLSKGLSGSGINNLTVGGQQFSPGVSSSIPNFVGSSSAVNAGLNALNPTVGSGGIQGIGSLGTQTAAKAGSMSALSKFGIGSALTAAGQFMGPKTPEVPQSEFAQMMAQGGIKPRTEIGNQAMAKAQELLAQNPQGLPQEYKDAVLADFKQQFADEERVLLQNYKSLRPYADVENDSAYQRDLSRLHKEQEQFKTNTLAKLEQANTESNKTFQRQDIMNAMGIDEQTFNEYASLANQDLNTIMMQTGIDYGQAQQFKDMFGKLGSMFISSGLGLDKSSLGNFVTSNGGIMG